MIPAEKLARRVSYLGSHLSGDDKPDFGPNGDKGTIDAELKAGEAFIMLGSLYHGGGGYFKSTRNPCTVHIMFMCSGIYRQEVSIARNTDGQIDTHNSEEISYLSYRIEDVKTYPPLVQ